VLTHSRSIAIDYLNERFTNANSRVVHIYFDYNFRQTQTGIDVIGNILKQLLSQVDNIPPEVECLYDESIRTGTKPNITTLSQLLTMCSQKLSIFAVFDAVDECIDAFQEELFFLFADLQKIGYKLLISTRPHIDLRNSLSHSRDFIISANESDLQNYVLTRLKNERNDNLKAKCLELVQGAQGM
jgi:hypothetical protein